MGVFRFETAYPIAMRAQALAMSGLILAAGCTSWRPFLPTPGYTRTLATYRPLVEPSREVLACRTAGHAPDPDERDRWLREESFCLLDVGSESGIPRLLEIALLTERADAVQNAGALAADTSERELYAMAVDPDPRVVEFALQALAHFSYRLARTTGDQRIAKAHADAARPGLIEGCAFGARSSDVRVELAGLDCLLQLRPRELVPELLGMASDTTRPTAVRRASLEVVQSSLGTSIDDATIDLVSGIVARPVPASAPPKEQTGRDTLEDELELRDVGCVILRSGLREREQAGRPIPTRAVAAAEAAYGDMESRSEIHSAACREVASTYGTKITPVGGEVDWFAATDLEHCNAPSSLKAKGGTPLDLCTVSIRAEDGGRRFTFELRDRASPRTLAKSDVPVTGTEYVDFARTATFELSGGMYVSLLSVTTGAPDVAAIVTPRLYVFDAQKLTWTEAWRGAPCPGCAPLSMTLAAKSNAKRIEIDVGAHRGGTIQNPTELVWDGQRISPR